VYFVADQLFQWYAAGAFGQLPSAESLKRAVWFGWASAALPCEETGVDALDDRSVHAMLASTLAYLRQHPKDAEFLDMLAWYHHLAPLAFSRFSDLDVLSVSAAARDPRSWQQRGWDLEQFHGRGAMGRYWTNLIKRHS
jgi:hypothetical protein